MLQEQLTGIGNGLQLLGVEQLQQSFSGRDPNVIVNKKSQHGCVRWWSFALPLVDIGGGQPHSCYLKEIEEDITYLIMCSYQSSSFLNRKWN